MRPFAFGFIGSLIYCITCGATPPVTDVALRGCSARLTITETEEGAAIAPGELRCMSMPAAGESSQSRQVVAVLQNLDPDLAEALVGQTISFHQPDITNAEHAIGVYTLSMSDNGLVAQQEETGRLSQIALSIPIDLDQAIFEIQNSDQNSGLQDVAYRGRGGGVRFRGGGAVVRRGGGAVVHRGAVVRRGVYGGGYVRRGGGVVVAPGYYSGPPCNPNYQNCSGYGYYNSNGIWVGRGVRRGGVVYGRSAVRRGGGGAVIYRRGGAIRR